MSFGMRARFLAWQGTLIVRISRAGTLGHSEFQCTVPNVHSVRSTREGQQLEACQFPASFGDLPLGYQLIVVRLE